MAAAPAYPLLLSLLAASLFGAQAVLARRALRHVDAQTGAMITILTSGAIFWAAFAWQAPAAQWGSPAVWVFLSAGLLHPAFSMWLSFEGNRRMGATVSATISSTTPLMAAAGAIALLGETISAQVGLGTLAVVGGIIVLSWSRAGSRGWAHSALVFPFGAALVRAFQTVWGRYGLTLLPAPLMAATLSFTVSSVLSLLAYRLRTGRLPLRLPPRGLMWAGMGGVCVAGAILSMYTALAVGAVVVVSPVTNAFPLFTLGWSLLFRQERFSGRIGVAVLLVVCGIALIGLR